MDGYPSLSTIIAFVSIVFSISAALHVPFRQFAILCTCHSGKWNARNILYLVRTLFHCLEIVAPENNIRQPVRPKIRVGVRVPGNPFMGVHSCSPSLFRRYLSQAVLDMKLSVLNSMSGFHLEMAPPAVLSFPGHL